MRIYCAKCSTLISGFSDFECKHHTVYYKVLMYLGVYLISTSIGFCYWLYIFIYIIVICFCYIFLSFNDLWSFTVVTWICLEYFWTVLFWVFLFFEGWRWGKWIYGTIKTLVEIKSMNKVLTPNLDSPVQYNFSNYYVFAKVNGRSMLHSLTFTMLHCSW